MEVGTGAGAYERILVRNRECLYRGWLPPAEECPELADLLAEHQRLLDAVDEALAKVGAAQDAAERASVARSNALREAIVQGTDPAKVKLPAQPSNTLMREARRVYEVTTEALEQFLIGAQRKIAERAPQIEAGLEARRREAHAKRAEARRLLGEADRLAAEPRRLQGWLDRYTGASKLDPIPFEVLDVPMPVPVPELFQEIAGLPPATVIDVGSDELTQEELEAIHEHSS